MGVGGGRCVCEKRSQVRAAKKHPFPPSPSLVWGCLQEVVGSASPPIDPSSATRNPSSSGGGGSGGGGVGGGGLSRHQFGGDVVDCAAALIAEIESMVPADVAAQRAQQEALQAKQRAGTLGVGAAAGAEALGPPPSAEGERGRRRVAAKRRQQQMLERMRRQQAEVRAGPMGRRKLPFRVCATFEC